MTENSYQEVIDNAALLAFEAAAVFGGVPETVTVDIAIALRIAALGAGVSDDRAIDDYSEALRSLVAEAEAREQDLNDLLAAACPDHGEPGHRHEVSVFVF